MECARLLLTLTVFFGLAYSELIKTQKCFLPSGQSPNCVVSDVNVDPCPEAAEGKACKLKLGSNATLTFNFTPTWSATKAGSQFYKVGLVDIPFETMDTNGCAYTTCPIEANKQHKYTFALELAKQFPVGTHISKLLIWNEEDHDQKCCFKMAIQLEP